MAKCRSPDIAKFQAWLAAGNLAGPLLLVDPLGATNGSMADTPGKTFNDYALAVSFGALRHWPVYLMGKS